MAVPVVPGLYYFDNIIDDDSLVELLEFLRDTEDWFPLSRHPNSRKVIHYGRKYNYVGRNANGGDAPPFPLIITHLKNTLEVTLEEHLPRREIVEGDHHDEVGDFVQCIINKYEPRQGISAHIDAPDYGPIIGCFTIGLPWVGGVDGDAEPLTPANASCGAMEFLHPEGLALPISIPTKHNSLYIMTGDARSRYQHQMTGRGSDALPEGGRLARCTRVSVTFRSIL
jgi:alkylated DNA repair dioxygenase AlkB